MAPLPLLPSLPNDVLVHIQSFMNFKDAARSATTCSGLYDTWYKIKNLDLDETSFRDVEYFWYGALKTIKRYAESELKLASLTIRMVSELGGYSPLKDVIDGAVALGVVEISIHLYNPALKFQIPASVFSPGKLIKLYVRGGVLDLSNETIVSSSSLKTLILIPDSYLGYIGPMLTNVFMKCPCLEKLECSGFMIWYDFGMLAGRLHCLESLAVENISYPTNIFFSEIIPLFTRLKSLCLKHIRKCRRIHICSPTIEQVTICERYSSVVSVFDVPKLQFFRYGGPPWSRFVFKSNKPGWISDITVLCVIHNHKWFSGVQNMLQSLEHSRIYLTVDVLYDNSKFTCDFTGDGSSAVEVEMLCIRTVSRCPGLIEGLQRVCRPLIVHHVHK